MTLGDFQPRWRHRKLCFASSYNQKKDNKFKNKNHLSCQKIDLYGSLTIKELKKKHSSRLVGGAEMGRMSREDSCQHEERGKQCDG